MNQPIVHVFSADIARERIDGYRQYAREHVALTESQHPGLLAYQVCLDQGGHRMASV